MVKKSKQLKNKQEDDILDKKFEENLKKQNKSQSQNDISTENGNNKQEEDNNEPQQQVQQQQNDDDWNTVEITKKQSRFNQNLNQLVGQQKKAKNKQAKKLQQQQKKPVSLYNPDESDDEDSKPKMMDIRSFKHTKKQLKAEQESVSGSEDTDDILDDVCCSDKSNSSQNSTKVKEESKKEEKEKAKKEKKKKKLQNGKEPKKSAFWDHICIVSLLFIGIFLMGYLKFIEEGYSRTKKISAGEYNNLYEILELDSSASQKDIKRAYKKMAVLWHPDKNPNCQDCSDKFSEILKAYEVLGKEESRQQYDATNGVSNVIKSQAIQLTSRNFESFVLESNDIWIIQVYENDDGWSNQVAPFWESGVEKYSHLVKFGRINRQTDYDILKYIPFNIQLIPTILSYIDGGSECNIYTYDSYNPELSIHNFIRDSIKNKMNLFDKGQSKSLYQELTQYTEQDRVDIVFISTSNTIPVELRYAAFKYNDVINFHVSQYGQRTQIQKDFNNTNDNIMLFYTNHQTKTREVLSFKMAKFNPKLFKNFLNLARFMVTPKIDRSSFKDYCENIKLRAGNEETTYNEDKQNLCIVINSNDENVKKEIDRVRDDTVKNIVKTFKEKKNKLHNIFEHYGHIQFIELDLEDNWRFKKVLTSEEHKFPFEEALSYAILAENRKISYVKNVVGIEDWILDLYDNDQGTFEYISDYEGADSKGIELAHLLRYKHDTITNLSMKAISQYSKDWKVLLTTLVAYISLSYIDKKRHPVKYVWHICLAVYISLILVHSYGDLYEELFH